MTTEAAINDRREILGWTMYDWANSAFSTTVVTTFLGPYLLALAQGAANEVDGLFYIGSYGVEPAAIFPFCVSLSVILQVFFLPILGTIADYTHLKKPMMMGFAYTGATATVLLFFIQGNLVLLGGLLFIIANLSFGAAIVFYNAFLPDITTPNRRDDVSSKGFAMGYLGGGILLLINLIMVQTMENTGLAVRLSLASAGLWWIAFTVLFPQRRLKRRAPVRQLPPGENVITHGIRQIARTARELIRKYPTTAHYLLAYLVYNDGIQTVIAISTSFAADEIEGVDTSILVLLVLMIQFVAFGGALAFGYLAQRIGAKRSIMISLVIWSGLVIFAFAFLYEVWQLFVLGFVLALVLGGSQALSRSLFSQMIPANHEAEYFGFYEVSERGTSWIGPLVFALAVQWTGQQRIAIVSLIIFFLLGLFLLSFVNVKKAIVDAGHDPSGVVL
jgi:UMF1 family MFS transporter